ncbi:MAG: beta-hydroxyacyl-ACP dehydratase [Thermogutta sp.]|nr:beta-hydroxyacyl-ACP dehydratase [Thermogutta sp.]
MAKKPFILDPAQIDTETVIADIHEIRKYNPQRFEMEQLTAICYDDPQQAVCVGYKDLTADEFWARGHFPGMPLMPGVLMCEAAAQLASYYALKHRLMNAPMVGFGGFQDVRFRGIVRPGDRFVIVVRLLRARATMMTCEFQCFVKQSLMCEGIMLGIPLTPEKIMADNDGEAANA